MMSLQLAVANAETELNNAAGSAAQFTAAAEGLQSTGDGMATVGKVLSIGLTLPVAAAGAAAVVMAGNYQQSLSILQSVTGATSAQMTTLGQKAVALGNDITLPGVSAAGAAQAMTELAKAGLSVNDVLGASKGVLALATAGQIDVQDAADTTAQALNAFGLAGTQATTIADLLAASANASTASVQDMALGLQMAGAQSHQMGISLQDTVTALALFSNAGINGSDAGTSLKQMFMQLATPTTAASALMKQLGLNFFDAKGNFIGLANTAQLLKTQLAGLTVEQKNNALATIFGADASRTAAVLADDGAAGFDAMSVAVNKQGAAAQLAAAQNSGFKGALDNLVSTVQTGLISAGTNLLPALTRALKSMADEVTDLTSWFGHLSSGQQDMIAKTLLWTAVLGPSLLVTGKLVKTVGSLVSIVGAASKALGFFSTTKLVSESGLATRALGSVGFAGAAEEGVTALGSAGGLAAVLGPVALGLGAVGLAAGGAYLLYKKFNDESAKTKASIYGANPGSGAGATTGGSVSLATLQQDALTDAQKRSTAAVTAYNSAVTTVNKTLAQYGTVQTGADASSKSLAEAQAAVSDALTKFGVKSPQYQQAVETLAQKQNDYYVALANTTVATLNVDGANGQLSAAYDKMNGAMDAQLQLQELYSSNLNGIAGAIANLKPIAEDAGSQITILQGQISGLSVSWNGFVSPLQGQITQVNNLLFGTGSTITQLQNSVNKLQASSSGIKISGGAVTIQGAGSSLQGHALGTQFAATDTYVAGETGPELITNAKGSTVTPASQTKGVLGNNKSVMIQNLNINNNVDAGMVVRSIGWKLATA